MFCFLSFTLHKLYNEAVVVSLGHGQPVSELRTSEITFVIYLIVTFVTMAIAISLP